ncbi:LexA-binding, inner membrane-associated putative hydrolase [Halorubrum ezzemoulense]|uniref:LexA-binding, inner membrane-associated putative hydrolase n=1 Tax=Halorubrum ezzemoulense TaxID=337243 RepID=A0A238YGV5_HALEZ|nr:metal-dependent hydrolase [Halorubrum ezzemoulense]SNR70028.1 LexA-binding, inner membrane-associated putative hydrolase [Halorubrum ezzemoulense]
MADLFTHILIGYSLGIVLSWRYEQLSYPFITAVMIGAALPDLKRIDLVLPEETVTALFGIPFTWTPLHRVGGTLLIVSIGALLVPTVYRRVVFACLAVGASSHYALDFLLYKPSGVTSPLLWPFITDGIAIDGLYLSSNRWLVVAAAALAGLIWIIDRRWMRTNHPHT